MSDVPNNGKRKDHVGWLRQRNECRRPEARKTRATKSRENRRNKGEWRPKLDVPVYATHSAPVIHLAHGHFEDVLSLQQHTDGLYPPSNGRLSSVSTTL